jgi:hypothetical protein
VLAETSAVSMLNELTTIVERREAHGQEMRRQGKAIEARLVQWGQSQPRVLAIYILPRLASNLIAVVASDEDSDGTLNDEMAGIDLELFEFKAVQSEVHPVQGV